MSKISKDKNKKTKKPKHPARVFMFCLILFLALVISSFFAIQVYVISSARGYILSDSSDAPECDAIMVLGALVYQSGRPSPLVADRLDYGYELYIQGKAKKILVSGDHGRYNYDEVNSMREYLMDKGVPREDIFMDHAGFNTYDSMYRAKAIFEIESLLISTQNFHIDRSVFIARKLGIDAYGYPCEDKAMYNMRWMNAREKLARVKAVWDTTVKRKPKYLGEVIPISGSGIATEG